MGLKIINVTIEGNSGQPTVAAQLSSCGHTGIKSRIFKLPRKSLFQRIFFAAILGARLRNGKAKYIVHLGLESIFAKAFYPLRGKVVFVNHGIYKFPFRFNVLRNCMIFFDRIASKGNDIFYVNREQMTACYSRFIFNNQPNLTGLSPFRSMETGLPMRIGFVGSPAGQKNNKVLLPSIKAMKNYDFCHLSEKSWPELDGFENYFHFSSSSRAEFFETIDVLLIPSIYESYCLIAYEAAYCRVKVVHSGVDGLQQFKYGVRVSDNSREGWRKLLNSLHFIDFSIVPVYKPVETMRDNLERILQCLQN